ncbi:unnamed protein product [Clavelina lepadiformis]|uniref:Uncharacterized protein n=1 Tax=Clavelina lepadiformis TaxID=159417 RepID=A0ABP0F7M0_CLALP
MPRRTVQFYKTSISTHILLLYVENNNATTPFSRPSAITGRKSFTSLSPVRAPATTADRKHALNRKKVRKNTTEFIERVSPSDVFLAF